MIKSELERLAAQAKSNKIHTRSEDVVKIDYILEILKLLGWTKSDWKLGEGQDVKTGKIPDIVLHDKHKGSVLVIECKDAKKADKLDGSYGKKTFVDQLFGYCRAEGIYWGILTNFVEWRLYNEPQKRLYENKRYAFMDLLWPGANPKAYTDILSDEGLAFLSKLKRTPLCQAKGKVFTEAIWYPLEKQIEDTKTKFFSRLKGWRESLRKVLYESYGQKHTREEIDLFTQKILDRMIFMEVCHDKEIIGQDYLSAILNSRDEKYKELKKRFVEMDERFNTELFAPGPVDKFSVGDETLEPIIKGLNEIDFKPVSVHIIGEVYENYLGEMLRVSKKQGLHAQESKEKAKRKSQGIYYTPEYIVDYIVKNTVGELLKNASTEEDITRLKVLDPACGSGSFLIKAFDLFLEAYRRAAAGKQTTFDTDLEIKKKILHHNIFGVDLDGRAVEITKLNLMLKALDGINWHAMHGRKLLPNLNLNIRCGNSLISGKPFAQRHEGELDFGFDAEPGIAGLLKLRKAFYRAVEDTEKDRLHAEILVEEERINRRLNDNLRGYFKEPREVKPLNFEVAFPEVFRQGGFDAVIGNPPYIGFHGFSYDKKYFARRYISAKGKFDYYLPFMEKGIEVLRPEGMLSFICPTNFMKRGHGYGLRKHLKLNVTIQQICDFQDVQIFEDAINYTGIFVLQKSLPSPTHKIFVRSRSITDEGMKVNQGKLGEDVWVLRKDKENLIVNSIESGKISRLHELAKGISEGIVTGKNDVYLFSEEDVKKYKLELDVLKPCIRGGEIRKYYFDKIKEYVIYPYENVDGKTTVLSESKLKQYSHVWEYLNEKKNALKGRPYFEASTKKWYELWCQRDMDLLASVKIVVPELAESNRFCIAGKEAFYGDTVCGISLNDIPEDIKYIIGILNSKLIQYYYQKTTVPKANRFYIYKTMFLRNIPIRRIDTASRYDKSIHDKMVKLVKEMLALNKTPALRERNKAAIAAVDREIDELVYKLYGVNDKDKRMIEDT